MRKTYSYILMASALLLASCEKQPSPTPTTDSIKMSFSVNGVEDMHTKCMIENITDLQRFCTPEIIGGTINHQESVGIWADLDYLGVTTENLLDDVQLAYYTKEGGNADGWNYYFGREEAYWQMGGKYRFRAYYPQQALKALGNDGIMANSNANTFIVSYNTLQMQDDLLVDYFEVDTRTWPDLSKPLNLNLKHALCAIKFQVQFKYTDQDKYYDEDALTACWLRNTKSDDFHSLGIMAYGITDPRTGTYDPHYMGWYPQYAVPVGDEIYKWEAPGDGIVFKNIDANGDGASGNDVYDPEHECILATAYSVAPDAGDMGEQYSKNGGWVFVIPQESKGTLELCFQTKVGGPNNVYTVKLPTVTGTDSTGPNANGTEWIPGYRYTYVISLSKSDVEVLMVNIAPWNKYDSSTDIAL